jgi:redox-sensitive bicupin YhaK (pirin superfamily)
MPSLGKVAEGALFKSEPNPAWFGNPANVQAAGWDQPNWLTSRFHFAFADWSAGRQQLGVLRVLNDDRVQPQRGFGTHGHANMEIVTYIVEGSLTHQDSMGSAESLGRGAVQYMTAGTGVRHSEHNLSPDEPLRFIQVICSPGSSGEKRVMRSPARYPALPLTPSRPQTGVDVDRAARARAQAQLRLRHVDTRGAAQPVGAPRVGRG